MKFGLPGLQEEEEDGEQQHHQQPPPQQHHHQQQQKHHHQQQQQQQQQREQQLQWPPSITILWPSFDAVELLGAGSFGQVHRIRHRDTGEEWACKSLPKDPAHLPAIMGEVGIMHHLSQGTPPSIPIVRLHGLLTHHASSSLGLVMDLCRGGTLWHFLQQQPAHRLSEPQAALVLHRLVAAVSHCHGRLVVHRDIKPHNVLMVRPSDLSSVCLADFGCSALLLHPSHRLSERAGTPGYMAPEVLLACDYSSQADVWSLGVLLFEMLSGSLPFRCALPLTFSTRADPWDAIVAALQDVCDDDLRLDGPPWHCISSSAKRLVQGMLRRDPSHRLSLRHISSHPWMQSMLSPPQTCKPLGLRDSPLPWLL